MEPYTTLGFPPNCARQALGATYRVKEIIENFNGTSLQRLVINFNCPGIDVIRQINCIIYPTWRGGREREGETGEEGRRERDSGEGKGERERERDNLYKIVSKITS